MTPKSGSSHLLQAVAILAMVLQLAAGVGLILALSYVLGHSILSGPLMGNDSPLHVGYAEWLNQYFPSIPHWYPLQGGGESLLHGYPIVPHLAVVVLHRLTQLSILQAYKLISFLTFPLIALSIYLFVWDAFRRQTLGLVAAIFYLLAPVSWTWMFDWGFFSQQVGLAFLPVALIAFSHTLKAQLDKRQSGRGRIWFVLLVIIMLAASLCHMLVSAAAAIGMLLTTLLGVLLHEGSGRRRMLRGGAKVLVLLGVITGLALAIYLTPFSRYGSVANREGLNTPPIHQLHRLPVPEFFGIQSTDQLNVLSRMQFPLAATAFAAVGLVLAWVQSRKGTFQDRQPLILGMTSLLAIIVTLTPAVIAVVLRVSPLLFNFLNFRSTLLLLMILFPTMAAYGTWAVPSLLIRPRQIFGSATPQKAVRRWALPFSLGEPAVSILAVSLVLGGSLSVWNLTKGGPASATYGPYPEGLDFSDPWNRLTGDGERRGFAEWAPSAWPPVSVAASDLWIEDSKAIADLFPDAANLRIDVSPHEGRLAMDLVTYANASQINSYTFQISLIHLMWGYQQNVFFSKEEPANEFGNPLTLSSAADWYGVEYAVLDPVLDPIATYEQAGWERYAPDSGAEIWRNPEPTGLASSTTRKAVLVIGKFEADAYSTIFRIANNGILPYQDVLLVEGRPRVDSYSLDELALFDAVVLYGHDYRNSQKAWELLDEYVSAGGGLFVDTGWEFWIPEWEFDPAPAVLPIARALWTNYGDTSDFALGAAEIAGEIDLSAFKPLSWEGQPWTLSGAEASDIRDWGQPVLSAAGRPLIVAGEHGQGRVVWSGMNLIGHARYGDLSTEELRLFGNLVRWGARAQDDPDLAAPTIARTYPDQIALQVNAVPGERTWVYWREAYYPNWHAYVDDSQGTREIPIYRGGPGFMLMPMESADARATVRLRWELPLVEQAAVAASLVGILLLIALAADGLFLNGNGFTWLKIGLIMRIPRPFLGEGSNREWAEMKRAELEAGQLSPDTPPHLIPSEAIAWWKGQQNTEPPADDSVGTESHGEAFAKKTEDGGRAIGARHPHPEGINHGDQQVHSETAGQGAEPAAVLDRDRDAHRPELAPAIEAGGEDVELALLESWLNGSGHSDDAWAEKLLARRRPTEPVGGDSDEAGRRK